ncbi:hypothetical protein ACQPYH_00980 [Kribbella sp. CA-245084]|uniref:hypothetical protein n=1 Tax=Kribbella sp. CA-245084 TaxID=3239940 RepID=UPI003D936667
MPNQKNTVTVTFNGTDREVPFEPHASVQALLEHAKKVFSVQSNHLLSLFTEDGIEITDDQQSADDAHIVAGALLILRQSTVRGGK